MVFKKSHFLTECEQMMNSRKYRKEILYTVEKWNFSCTEKSFLEKKHLFRVLIFLTFLIMETLKY